MVLVARNKLRTHSTGGESQFAPQCAIKSIPLTPQEKRAVNFFANEAKFRPILVKVKQEP
jgi:hypothetical protein